MKKVVYALMVLLVVASGLIFANHRIKNNKSPKPLSIDKKAGTESGKKWDASPDGLKFNTWKSSSAGKKVYASHDKIRKYIKEFTQMEAVVTSVSFRWHPNGVGPKWLIVGIKGEKYMMQFNAKEFQALSKLKVNDKIIVKSHAAGYSPNHPYLIIWGDYIEQNNKVLYKRELRKKGRC